MPDVELLRSSVGSGASSGCEVAGRGSRWMARGDSAAGGLEGGKNRGAGC